MEWLPPGLVAIITIVIIPIPAGNSGSASVSIVNREKDKNSAYKGYREKFQGELEEREKLI